MKTNQTGALDLAAWPGLTQLSQIMEREASWQAQNLILGILLEQGNDTITRGRTAETEPRYYQWKIEAHQKWRFQYLPIHQTSSISYICEWY